MQAEMQRAGPVALPFALQIEKLDSSSAADKVHDEGDDGKDQQQMNEEAADVEDKKTAKPEDDQHNSQNEKHE
jgi:hypothetical protein